MSKIEQDKYLEDLQRAEEDLRDAMESYDNAKEETRKAFDWESKMKLNVVEFQEVLEKIKNRE